jgi:DNA-binding protein HU-beta
MQGAAPGRNKRFKGDKTMANQMTKTQLIAAVADKAGTDKKAAAAVIDALADVIVNEVAAGGAVTLPGVAKIYCRAREERMVRNPATNEQVRKPADKQVKVSVAKGLKDRVNG